MTIGRGARRCSRTCRSLRASSAPWHDCGARTTCALGQPSTTLSGGEAQRVKLASELAHRPATGQHALPARRAHDRAALRGHRQAPRRHRPPGGSKATRWWSSSTTLDVIKCADHLIDIGPEGGDAGGTAGRRGHARARRHGSTRPRAGARGPRRVCGSPTGPPGRRQAGAVAGGAHEHARRGPRPGRAQAQPQAHRRRHPARHVHRHHGREWLGQDVAGLRHHLRRGAAPLRESRCPPTPAASSVGSSARRSTVSRACSPPSRSTRGTSSHNPRSTVATVTEIHDVLRLLYARVGDAALPALRAGCSRLACDPAMRPSMPSKRPLGSRCRLAHHGAPPGRPSRGAAGAALRDGWQRLLGRGDDRRARGAARRVGPGDRGARARRLVVDRPVNPGTGGPGPNLSEAWRRPTASATGTSWPFARATDGRIWRWTPIGLVLSRALHGPILPELTPRHFSFNSRLGACAGLRRPRARPSSWFPRASSMAAAKAPSSKDALHATKARQVLAPRSGAGLP